MVLNRSFLYVNFSLITNYIGDRGFYIGNFLTSVDCSHQPGVTKSIKVFPISNLTEINCDFSDSFGNKVYGIKAR